MNEGVNVPEANVAVVLSGSGSVREHVQRLGRVLRKSGDKEAVLYEVITHGYRRGIHLDPPAQTRRLRGKLTARVSSCSLATWSASRLSKQRVMPLYIDRDAPHWLEAAESLLLLFREGTGMTRGEIESEIDELFGGGGKATQVYRGIAKVLEDRAEFRGGGGRPTRPGARKSLHGGRRA